MSKNKAETDFYMYTKMVGIEQLKPDTFRFNGQERRVKAWVNPETAKALGGKPRAFKMLRYALFIQHMGATPEGQHIAGIVGASFDALSQEYPLRVPAAGLGKRVGHFRATC